MPNVIHVYVYDLHKMTEGHQDAVTMAAYLPQPRIGETFSSKIDVEGLKRFNPELTDVLNNLTPTSYADLIFNKIEKIVKDNNRYLSIARTPSDLYEDKRKGRKSIMFAIENGLALEGDLANVKYFAQRGVTYITLCHNGDNDICDSARGSNLHGGVSKFGAAVDTRNESQWYYGRSQSWCRKSFTMLLRSVANPLCAAILTASSL